MEFRPLSRLLALGLVERKPVAREMVQTWLTRSREDLGLVRDVLVDEHIERAASIAYEAGYRGCAGVVALAGYRIRSVRGHHQAAIEGAGAVLGKAFEGPLRRMDRARRLRNQSLYGSSPRPGRADLDQLIEDVAELLEELARRLEGATEGDGHERRGVAPE